MNDVDLIVSYKMRRSTMKMRHDPKVEAEPFSL